MKKSMAMSLQWDRTDNVPMKNGLQVKACISGIRTKVDLEAAMKELVSFGFSIDEFVYGELDGVKYVNDPFEILKPEYDGYRYLARECED